MLSRPSSLSLSLSLTRTESKRTRLLFMAPSLSLSARVQLEANSLCLELHFFLLSSICSSPFRFPLLRYSPLSHRYLFYANKSFSGFLGFSCVRVYDCSRIDDYGSSRGGVSFLRSSRNRMIRFGRCVTRFSRRCREARPPVPTP